MYNNHEPQDQDLQLAAANQIVELDDNELDNITGGVASWFSRKSSSPVHSSLFMTLVGASLSNPKA